MKTRKRAASKNQQQKKDNTSAIKRLNLSVEADVKIVRKVNVVISVFHCVAIKVNTQRKIFVAIPIYV